MAKKKVTTIKDGTALVRGEVTITKLKNGVPIQKVKTHNNAVANLLIGVARYIRGDFLNLPGEGTSFIPAYLGVGYTTSSQETSFTQTHLVAELTQYENRFDVSKEGITIDTTSTPASIKLGLRAVIPAGVLAVNTEINEVGLFAERKRADSVDISYSLLG